jgi:hypothetical protein
LEHIVFYLTDFIYSNVTLIFFLSSKALLLAFLSSPSTINKIGDRAAEGIVHFLRNNVFTIEDHFAAYHYHNVRCFRDYSNTPLEGTNAGLKYGDFAVQSTMKLAKSSSYMIAQDEAKQKRAKIAAENDFLQRRLCNLGQENGKRLVVQAFASLTEQIQGAEYYASLRTGENTWKVIQSKERTLRVGVGLFPKFQRLRVVERNKSNKFTCTCGFPNQWGIPCRHIIHVICYYYAGNDCYTFSHRDVDVRWWTTYRKYVALYKPDCSSVSGDAIHHRLLFIRKKQWENMDGTVQLVNFETVKYKWGKYSDDKFKDLTPTGANALFNVPETRVTNYSDCDVQQALALMDDGFAFGITQFSYVDSGDDEMVNSNDDIDFSERTSVAVKNLSKQNIKQKAAHDWVMPRVYQLIALIENKPDDQKARLAKLLDDEIFLLKQEDNNRPPTGIIVSSEIGGSNQIKNRKHKRQRRFII